jgi:hypothetical protein
VRRLLPRAILVSACTAALATGAGYAGLAWATAARPGAVAVSNDLSVSIFNRSANPQDKLPDSFSRQATQLDLDAASTRLAYQSQELNVYVGLSADSANLCLFLDFPDGASVSCGPASVVSAGRTQLLRRVDTDGDSKPVAWLVGVVGDSAQVVIDGGAVEVRNNVFATQLGADAPAQVVVSTAKGSYAVSANPPDQADNGKATIQTEVAADSPTADR